MERSTNWFVLLLLTTLGAFPTFGTVCTTIADGAFTNAAIWSCGCDPSTCDTLIIENEVSHEGDLILPIDLIHITVSGSLTATGMLGLYAEILCEGTITAAKIATDVPHQASCSGVIHADVVHLGNGPPLINTGQIIANDSLQLGYFNVTKNYGSLIGGYCLVLNRLDNHGSCEFNNGLYAVGFFFNYASVSGRGKFRFNGTLVMDPASTIGSDTVMLVSSARIHGTITTDSVLFSGDGMLGVNLYLYGDGSLICHGDFFNTSDSYIHGGGSICIGRHSENHGMLESVDICDATPTVTEEPILDVNDGTVWNSVNYCQNGFCASLTEVDERSVMDVIQVVPNPASGHCTIRLPSGSIVLSYDLFDTHGRMVAQRNMPWRNELELDAPTAGAGMYTLVLHGPGGTRAMRSVVFLP